MHSLICLVLFFSQVFSLTPPNWGNSPVYFVSVNLTNPSPVATWKFDYYYDSSRFNITGSRYNHYPPQFDEMCVDPTIPNSTYECDVIFAVDGWTYLSFPTADFCCKCENTFGSTNYDWMKENSTFVGHENINGIAVEHWTKQGQYLNHYYCDAKDKKPIRFNELWGPDQVLKQWDYIIESYDKRLFDTSFVEAPKVCQTFCMSEACKEYRSIQI